MSDVIDQFLKMERDLERMHDPLGVGALERNLQRMHDPLGVGALERDLQRMHDPLGVGALERDLLQRTRDIAGLGRIDDVLGRRDSVFSFVERYARDVELVSPRAFDLASTIGDLANSLTGIASMKLNEIGKTLQDNGTNSLLKTIESTMSLDRALAGIAPLAHVSWLKDLNRSFAPWLTAHDALWPRDSLVLRMLERNTAFGVASWLGEPVNEAELPPFEMGALTQERVDGGRIDIDHEVCCALCRNQIFTPSSEARWIGPRRIRMRTEIVPICIECTARDARETGYLRNALLAFVDQPSSPERLRFEVYDGEETDPAPRGRLTLVRHESDPDEPSDE